MDWITNKIYWATISPGRIGVIDIATGMQKTVILLQEAVNLVDFVIDPLQR